MFAISEISFPLVPRSRESPQAHTVTIRPNTPRAPMFSLYLSDVFMQSNLQNLIPFVAIANFMPFPSATSSTTVFFIVFSFLSGILFMVQLTTKIAR